MARAKFKLSPAIADRTSKQDGDSEEEGMEAVLFHNKERRERHRRSNMKAKNPSGLADDDETSPLFELPQDTELLDVVQGKNWEALLYRLMKEPHAAHVKFTGRSTNSPSAGNLVLHEVCKQKPPLDVVQALVEVNDKAARTKGNSGYLPFHYACAHGASIEVVEFLYELYPEAVREIDEEEGVLPLHLACIYGSTKEDVYMFLLMDYPEGCMVKDDFGRLPIDYAKSIRSDSHRKIAIECLRRAKWIQIASIESKERTENDYKQRIKGYEESQAQHLKMLEEMHTKEISDLETRLESKEKELSDRSQEMKELDLHLQEMTDQFRERIEAMEKSMKTKTRKLQARIEQAKEETKKTKEALNTKVGEANELEQNLDKTKELNDSLNRLLEERSEELDLALEDIETLNKHTEWLESVVDSVKNLTDSKSPLLRSTPRNRDISSVSSKKSEKLSRGVKSRF